MWHVTSMEARSTLALSSTCYKHVRERSSEKMAHQSQRVGKRVSETERSKEGDEKSGI